MPSKDKYFYQQQKKRDHPIYKGVVADHPKTRIQETSNVGK
jgi:hypothetical protein